MLVSELPTCSSRVSPQCCEGMKRCKTIIIRTRKENGDEPYWRINASIDFNDLETFAAFRDWDHDKAPFEPDPTHCPFCGTALPEIVAAPKKTPFHDGDGNDNCRTCGEDYAYCSCWPPWSRWKPK